MNDPTKKDGLYSLWGEGHLNATRTRECVAMPGARNQVVCTGREISARVENFFDLPRPVDQKRREGTRAIAYDPCGCEPEHDHLMTYTASESTRTRGLIDPWPDRTLANPPYGRSLFDPESEMERHKAENHIREQSKRKGITPVYPWGKPLKMAGLKDWLDHQIKASEGRSIMVSPVRSNRRWWREWARCMTGIVFLDPHKFAGYKQAFPAPLCLGYFVPGPIPGLEKSSDPTMREDFFGCFEDIGDPIF